VPRTPSWVTAIGFLSCDGEWAELDKDMTRTAMQSTMIQLEQHVREKRRRDPGADEEELVNHFLEALDLAPADHLAICDEYRRRKKLSLLSTSSAPAGRS
jgi:hypothetical protein